VRTAAALRGIPTASLVLLVIFFLSLLFNFLLQLVRTPAALRGMPTALFHSAARL
jgi:hypothetical protein